MLSSLVGSAQDTTIGTVTTVADKGTSGKCFVCYHAKSQCNISNIDAEAFSIYTDNGKPYFGHVRHYKGKYNIDAGDKVILKNDEPKEVAVVEASFTTKKRSVMWDDIISYTKDTPLEDFKAKHPIKEGEYVYMLTNLEHNGGFGFTHFTGTIMKAGNFYIVSTHIPEAEAEASTRANTRALKDIEDGDPVPFLVGEAGDDDGFTAQIFYTKGDANGDGKVNVADIVEIVNYINGIPSVNFLFAPADANNDGEVNSTDIDQIVNNTTLH